MRHHRAPQRIAASTYGAARTRSTSARMTRVNAATLVAPMATAIWPVPTPSAVTRVSESRSGGTDIVTSTARMMTASAQLPKNPATSPRITPPPRAMRMARAVARSDRAAPWTTRA